MRIPRIFQDTELHAEDSIILDAQATTHVARVLRLKEGHELIVFNGKGGEYHAHIEQLKKRCAKVVLDCFVDNDKESALRVTLLQSVSRGEKMDFTIQKAVELGVTRIIPIISKRTNVHLDEGRRLRRQQHWQMVAISACEQCGRNTIPSVEPIVSLEKAFAEMGEGPHFILHPEAEQGIKDIEIADKQAVSMTIGPEGGFADEELQLATQCGFTALRFGPRVLRTETAALALLSAMQTLWGDT